jgi:hypothetical protein
MTTFAVVSSSATFGKESIARLEKDMREIKGMLVAQWEPDEATAVSPCCSPAEVNNDWKLWVAIDWHACPEDIHWKYIWIWGILQKESHGALGISWAASPRLLTAWICQNHIKSKPGEFGLATYPSEHIQVFKIEWLVQEKINSAKSLIMMNVCLSFYMA